MNRKQIDEIVKQPIDSQEISEILPNPNIVMLKDVSNMNSLNEIFKNYDYAIIFVSTNAITDGHWQCIFKNINNDICFMDSYAMNPTEMVKRLEKLGHELYGQNYNLLQLLTSSEYYPHKIFVNKHKYQKDGLPETCGRYVLLCLVLHIYYKKQKKLFTFETFYKILTAMKNKLKMDYDETVSYIIPENEVLNN